MLGHLSLRTNQTWKHGNRYLLQERMIRFNRDARLSQSDYHYPLLSTKGLFMKTKKHSEIRSLALDAKVEVIDGYC
jgi:hypothetical protein